MFSCQYLLWTKFGKQPAGHCLTAHPEEMIPRHLSSPDDPAVRLSHKGTGRRVEQSGRQGLRTCVRLPRRLIFVFGMGRMSF